jgi:hypothetical protein
MAFKRTQTHSEKHVLELLGGINQMQDDGILVSGAASEKITGFLMT